MAINNSHKPVGSNVNQDSPNRVGNTYAERKNRGSQGMVSSELQVLRSRDFFGPKPNEANPVDRFGANATYEKKQAGANNIMNALENGRKRHGTIPDNIFLNFLDKVIANPGDNKPPAQVKTQVKSAIKLIKA